MKTKKTSAEVSAARLIRVTELVLERLAQAHSREDLPGVLAWAERASSRFSEITGVSLGSYRLQSSLDAIEAEERSDWHQPAAELLGLVIAGMPARSAPEGNDTLRKSEPAPSTSTSGYTASSHSILKECFKRSGCGLPTEPTPGTALDRGRQLKKLASAIEVWSDLRAIARLVMRAMRKRQSSRAPILSCSHRLRMHRTICRSEFGSSWMDRDNLEKAHISTLKAGDLLGKLQERIPIFQGDSHIFSQEDPPIVRKLAGQRLMARTLCHQRGTNAALLDAEYHGENPDCTVFSAEYAVGCPVDPVRREGWLLFDKSALNREIPDSIVKALKPIRSVGSRSDGLMFDFGDFEALSAKYVPGLSMSGAFWHYSCRVKNPDKWMSRFSDKLAEEAINTL
ncbi:MAG: hypothetical protein GY811_05655 [Myxococcales bacterium]|nr:hypothetical protein [Myxococcales bacterium]